MALNPTERFTTRVADYVRYRPDYPAALVDWLHREPGVPAGAQVADIGAGTGISSRLFLDGGHPVSAVEPNAAMRAAAVRWLGGDARFAAVAGSAEATTLADASVDLIAAAQAFHWFDQQAVKDEWRRILRPHGLVVVFWNSRRLSGTPFLEGYEQLLLDYGLDYSSVSERYNDDASMAAWFDGGLRGMARFDHGQLLDFDALRGRLLSSSLLRPAGRPSAARADAGGAARPVRCQRGRWPGELRLRHPGLCRYPWRLQPLRNPPMNTVARPTSSLAVVSLVFGILGWTVLPAVGAVVAVITGHMARAEIRRSAGQLEGDGMAVAGLVLGWLAIGLAIAAVLAFILFFGGIAALAALDH